MLHNLLAALRNNHEAVANWLDEKRSFFNGQPVYASVDVRNAGFKIAPVDTNLFPAGWNNLCPSYAAQASKYLQEFFTSFLPDTKCLVIIPENHTRNSYYFSNVKRLLEIIRKAGFIAEVGTINSEITEPTDFKTAEEEQLTLYPITREGDNLLVNGKKVCRFIVNNDFSDGVPKILQGLKPDQLLPTPEIGWHSRKKSKHFQAYHSLIAEVAEILNVPVWQLDARFTMVEQVSLDKDTDRELIAAAVDKLLAQIKADYVENGVTNHEPTVFVKSDAGTYGMAIMSVTSGDEIRNLNRKARNKMRVGKGNVTVTDLIIQEGVPTTDRLKGFVAEPVIYLVGSNSVGGFYRLNEERGDNENLNSRGMKFSKLCFHEKLGYENLAEPDLDADTMAELYSLIGSVASLAAGQEIADLI